MNRLTLVVALAAAALAAPARAQYLYGIDPGRNVLVRVDPATAQPVEIGPLGIDVNTAGADFACDGTFWILTGALGGGVMTLATVDLETGAATVVRTFDVTGLPTNVGFEFGPDESTPYWRSGAGLFTLDLGAGTVSQIAAYPVAGVSLTMPATCDAFLSADGEGLVSIDPASGGRTLIAPSLALSSLAAAPDGSLYGDGSGTLYRVDPVTGSDTLVGPIAAAPGSAPYSLVGMAYGPAGVCCKPPDGDGDGVPDSSDACPGTGPGAIIDASGCSIDDLCPCAGVAGVAWGNHGAYVSCIAHTVEAFLASGLVTDAQKDAIVSSAARGGCGKKR
jgi:hypothetical protein